MTTADFLDALLTAHRPVVMELKCRTGDGTDLLAGRAPGEVVASFEEAGAPCLSVVTGRWFGGTPGLLREVTRRTRLPVLQKDFLTRQRDLDTAVELGAAAVLLTVALLPATVLARMVDGALRRGLTPFVEVTTEAEVAAVPQAADCVIAVNNSDIAARERSGEGPGRSLGLLPAVTATGTRCPVSAGGIGTPADGARLVNAGFAGLLVGTGLLRSGDPTAWMAGFERNSSPR